MGDFNVETMSIKDLWQLHKAVAKAISTFGYRVKSVALFKLETIAKEIGYSLADLMGETKKITRAPAVAKYRHPENPALTW